MNNKIIKQAQKKIEKYIVTGLGHDNPSIKGVVDSPYIEHVLKQAITQAVEKREDEIKKIIDKECKSNKDYLKSHIRPGTHYYNGFLHGSGWLHGLKNKLHKLLK